MELRSRVHTCCQRALAFFVQGVGATARQVLLQSPLGWRGGRAWCRGDACVFVCVVVGGGHAQPCVF